MQKFIEADYYELDWYYEECTDGNYTRLFYCIRYCLQLLIGVLLSSKA